MGPPHWRNNPELLTTHWRRSQKDAGALGTEGGCILAAWNLHLEQLGVGPAHSAHTPTHHTTTTVRTEVLEEEVPPDRKYT